MLKKAAYALKNNLRGGGFLGKKPLSRIFFQIVFFLASIIVVWGPSFIL
jgi:hypothetical protein